MIFEMANHGQLRELNATDQEIEIFEIVKEMAAPDVRDMADLVDNSLAHIRKYSK